MTLLTNKTKKDDQGTWHKVSDVPAGAEIAVPSDTGELMWDKIVSIAPVGREQVYDIEVEGTHNFVGNDIFAHNTYVLKSGDLTANAPDEVLTADKAGVDLAKLATHTLHDVQDLAAEFAAEDVKLVSLESRVDALESGAVGTGSTTVNVGTGLASAFESFGALIQKGIAQFNTLVFRQLVASSDADGTSSAGSISLISGNTVAQVSNSMVKPSTKIFVTFNSQIAGSWWVSDKADGSFRVVLSEAQAGDVSFDYFLVQTEGQIGTPAADGSMSANAAATSGTGAPDTEAPVITLIGDNPLHLSVGGSFVEPGVQVTDNSGATPTVTTYVNGIEMPATTDSLSTSAPITYIITYSATDAAGNNATARRSVIVGASDAGAGGSQTSSAPADTVAPVVTLAGDAAMQITAGDNFTDPGATATDDVDGALTPIASGSVDSATPGLYTITYTATDAAGNVGTASRVVTVVAQ